MKIIDKLNKTPDGFVKEKVVIARIGAMEYLGSDLGMPNLKPDEVYDVFVDAENLLNDRVVESAEGATVTLIHPDELETTTKTHKRDSVGHVQNIYVEGDYLKGTIFVKDANAIAEIERGIKEVSLGYDSDIIEKDGKLYKTNIRVNHVAIVPEGRCGSSCKIGDSKKEVKKMAKPKSKLGFRDRASLLTSGKTVAQRSIGRKLNDSKVKTGKVVKFVDSRSEQLKQKLADMEEVTVNPDATPEEKAAAAQEVATIVNETLDEVKDAVDEILGLNSEIEEEVADMPIAVGDADLDEEAAKTVAELEAEILQLQEELATKDSDLQTANERIATLEAEIEQLKAGASDAAVVNDAKMRFPKAKINDSMTARQAKEAVLVYKRQYTADGVKKLTDCALDSDYSKATASSNSLRVNLNDKAGTKKVAAAKRLGG